jgi:hypothetical protein
MGKVSVVDITTAASRSTKIAGYRKLPIAENRSSSGNELCVSALPAARAVHSDRISWQSSSMAVLT